MNLHLTYPSLADLVVKSTAPSEMAENARASRDKPMARVGRDRDQWAGANWEDALQMAQTGDIEGARRLAPAVLDAVNSIIHNQSRFDPVYRLDEGRWIDVARYVKGEPECWGDMVEGNPSPRKGAAIIVNVAAASKIQPSEIDRVGIDLGSAVLGLQAMGYSITLYAVEKITGYGNESTLMISAPVNPGGAPLDVSRMSIILRPWYLRRILFSLAETLDAKTRGKFGIGNGYGHPAYINAMDAEKISGFKNTVIVNVQQAIKNYENVKDIILRQIKGV